MATGYPAASLADIDAVSSSPSPGRPPRTFSAIRHSFSVNLPASHFRRLAVRHEGYGHRRAAGQGLRQRAGQFTGFLARYQGVRRQGLHRLRGYAVHLRSSARQNGRIGEYAFIVWRKKGR